MDNNAFQRNNGQHKKLKFTVITVALNTEKVIEKTIQSVLEQTVSPYEYLIVDGLSTDKTVEIAEKYYDDFAKKSIKYTVISEKDKGIFNAMNKSIKLASGDFISFLNAGDWYEVDALEKIQSFYDEESFDLTYGSINYRFLDGRTVIKKSRLDHFPVSTRHWNHPSMFLKREIYLKYGFQEDFMCCGDFDLFLKLRKDGIKIRVIDKVITNYVTDGLSTNPDIKLAIHRASEKYRSYRANGYSIIYLLEAYGWELGKNIILRLHRKEKTNLREET